MAMNGFLGRKEEPAKILIIDDESSVIEQLMELLDAAGHDPDFIPKPEFMMPKLKESSFDLILLDLNMPNIYGLTLLEELKTSSEFSSIPVIVLTGDQDDKLLASCLEKGAVDFLNKPIREVVLKARVQAALAVKKEQDSYRNLLNNILPKTVSDDLLGKGFTKSRHYTSASVAFCDIVGFTSIAADSDPEWLVDRLDAYFARFDEVMERHGLEKIKTIGDCYMYAGGIPDEVNSHAYDCVQAAIDLQNVMQEERDKGGTWGLRIGIHSGPIVTGVIGKKKFAYDIWGDTVNIASRMEANGVDSQVNISGDTMRLLNDAFDFEDRGRIPVKGKGDMDMFFVKEKVKQVSV